MSIPFDGAGVRIPSLVGMAPSADEIKALAAAIGIAQARSWLYLAYATFGSIDWVYALGVQDGEAFGPIDDSNQETAETTFVDVMVVLASIPRMHSSLLSSSGVSGHLKLERMTALGPQLPVMTVRDFSTPATCYAVPNGRDRPRADVNQRANEKNFRHFARRLLGGGWVFSIHFDIVLAPVSGSDWLSTEWRLLCSRV